MKKYLRTLFVLFVALAAIHCFQGNPVGAPVTTGNSTQVSSVYAGLAMYSDNFGVAHLDSKDKPMVAVLGDFLKSSLESKATAAACPNPLLASSNCGAGSSVTVALGGCNPSLNSGANWTGSALFTFDSHASCVAAVPAGITSLPAGGSVTMTSAVGITRTASAGGQYVEIDSQPSGYVTTVSGGETMAAGNGVAPCAFGRCVTVNGLHRAVYSATGTLLYDYSISNNTMVTLQGTGSSLQIGGGALFMQDNLNKQTLNVVVSGPLIFNGTCCFPVGGQLTTTYPGITTKYTEVTTLGPACGQASVNGIPFTLSHCL